MHSTHTYALARSHIHAHILVHTSIRPQRRNVLHHKWAENFNFTMKNVPPTDIPMPSKSHGREQRFVTSKMGSSDNYAHRTVTYAMSKLLHKDTVYVNLSILPNK